MLQKVGTGALCFLIVLAGGSAGVSADEHEEEKKNGWYRKGIHFESADGSSSINIGGRIQGRFTQEDPETGESVGSFRIRRARLTFQGRLYEHWKYKFQAGFEGSSAEIKDASFQYTKHRMAQPWLGQGKIFFGRQFLTSSGKLQFVDRSIASARFAPGRDQGVALVGKNAENSFEYNVGVYNGNGVNQSSNDNDAYLTVARAVWTPFGEVKLEEGSLAYPERSTLAIGLSGMTTTEDVPDPLTPGAFIDDDIDRYGFEAAYSIRGFNAVAEFYTETSTVAGVDADTDGYYVQLGYLFPNKKFEIAARSSEVSPDVAGPSADETETGVALSYYLDKHRYKLQLDLRSLENDADPTEDTDEARLQVQFQF